jgi:hypothetical protein
MSDEQPEYLEQRARVALAVGSFVIAFNQVDLLSHKAIEVLCDEPLLFGIATTEWQFEPRRQLAVRLLDYKRIAPPDLVETWKQEWGKAQDMANHRSHIAHGHMSMLGSPESPDAERFGVFSLKKAGTGKPDFNMTLAEVEALTPAAYELVSRLSALIERVGNCPWRDQLVPRSRGKS